MKNEYNRIDYDMLSTNVLVEYVEAVLLKYVDEDGKFNDASYFYEVFTKNVDIWGFLIAYVPLIEFGSTIFNPELINGVCRILLRYCFSTEFATKPIIVSELVTELESLNDIVNARIFKLQSKKLSQNNKPSQTKKPSQSIKKSQTKKQSQNILPSISKDSSDIVLDYSE